MRSRFQPAFFAAACVAAHLACFTACSGDDSSSEGSPSGDGGPTQSGDANGGGSNGPDGGAGADGQTPGPDGQADATPGYTPKSIPGLSLWLESTMGLGAKLATWADQSGSGNDAVLSAGAEAPDFNAGNQNGHQGLVFHGYTTYEIADAAGLQLGTGDFLIEAVCHNNYNSATKSSKGTNETAWTWYEGSYIRYRFGEVVSKIPSGTGPGLSLVFNDWTDLSYKIVGQISTSAAVKMPSAFYLEEPRILGFRRKGSVLELRSNGVATSTVDDAGAEANGDVSAVGTKLYVGGRPSLTHFVGAIWEVIVVKGTVADADVAAFEAYAKAKYAL